MKPICVRCQLFFKPHKNGVAFEEGMPISGHNARTNQITNWGPYKLWLGDLWKCRGCGAEIIVGVGQHAVAEHFQTHYEREREILDPLFRVDDC